MNVHFGFNAETLLVPRCVEGALAVVFTFWPKIGQSDGPAPAAVEAGTAVAVIASDTRPNLVGLIDPSSKFQPPNDQSPNVGPF
ncbi:MAG: hypothetical protein J2P22_08515 [Nocardioides sp.]|nr:hypothetical protein [Nocardioides sp.]